MSAAPIVNRIRIIPRPSDFLDRNVGSSGEVFFNKTTNSLRVYSGKDVSGFEIARADLSNISNSDFTAKATAAGISGATPEWDSIVNKPTFSTVAISGSYTDLTDAPDLTTYATKNYVDNAIGQIEGVDGSLAIIPTSFFIAADDFTQREVNLDETIKIAGGTGISTASDAEGNITITYTGTVTSSFNSLTEVSTAGLTVAQIYEPAIAMLRVDNVGASAYTFPSHYNGNNPTIYAISGTTIAFDLSEVSGHPFEIQDNTLTAFDTGLVHVADDGTVSTGSNAQGKDSGVLYWRIPETEAGTFAYQCQFHAAMVGTISVKRLSTL